MKKRLVLLVILLLALFLRVYHLDSNPPGLTPDEASLGYNAYSILKTGRDEYGTLLPVIFKSFGDYKPGLYVYLTVPSVAILGLNEISVRLPSVIAGVTTVLLVYLITKQLFRRDSIASLQNDRLPIIAAAVAATNPWLIYFSRGAWEVNVALTLTLVGIYFFLKSRENQRLIILSSFFFSLTLVDYQGAKLSTGIVVGILALLYWRDVLKFKFKYLTLAGAAGLIISLPIILGLFNGQGARLTVFSVFSYPRPAEYLQAFLNEGNVKRGGLVYDLFYSEPLNFARGVAGRFFNHFSARFLFFVGDSSNPRHTPPNQGVLVIGDMVILLYGFIVLLKGKIDRPKLFILLWLVLAPLPAILSRDQVHAVRAFNLAIPFVVIIAFGIYGMLSLRSSMTNNFLKLLVFGIYAATYVYFLDAYFVHQPIHNSQYWQYGYKQMVETVEKYKSKYKEIKIQQSYDQPYIYFLFYTKYDPAKYQKQAKLNRDAGLDVGHVESLDNICFCGLDWSRDRGDHGDLVIGDISVIPPLDSNDPKLFTLVDEIKYKNGQTAWRVLDVK